VKQLTCHHGKEGGKRTQNREVLNADSLSRVKPPAAMVPTPGARGLRSRVTLRGEARRVTPPARARGGPAVGGGGGWCWGSWSSGAHEQPWGMLADWRLDEDCSGQTGRPGFLA